MAKPDDPSANLNTGEGPPNPARVTRTCIVCDEAIPENGFGFQTGICRRCKEALKEFVMARRKKK